MLPQIALIKPFPQLQLTPSIYGSTVIALVNEVIEDKLYAIEPFILAPRLWAQVFVRLRTYDAVARALLRHLKAGSNRFTPDILHIGSKLL